MKYEKHILSNDNSAITEITNIVSGSVNAFKLNPKEKNDTILAVEEVAGSLLAHTNAGAKITLSIFSFNGKIFIELSSVGEKYIPTEITKSNSLLDDELGDGAQDMIRNILLKSMTDRVKYRHVNNKNRFSITSSKSKNSFLFQTLGALFLGIIIGLILSHVGNSNFNSSLDNYLLVPLKTMYLNGLKMVVAPVVFFSIVSCIVNFSDISELGRVGARVLSLYLFTTFIAVGVGIGLFFIFSPGSALPSEAAILSAQDITSKTMDVSIKDTIVNIVPSDFVQPFLESNMLQLIFLAVICGIAAGMIGRYSYMVKAIFQAFNDLFLKITTIIIHFLPIAVFCSICSMMMNMGISALKSVLGMFGTFILGLICMMIVYCLIMAIVGHMNPIPFIKKYPSTMIQVFSMASSNASIPLNMKACESLGISKKIYSLSIPLGATVNMDGSCVYMAIFALALAKTYGIPITGASITGLVLSIVVLSIGAPGIPGSGLICLSVLLTQIGVPTEAVGLIMGIDSLVGMFRCMSNCTGDVAMSVVVARKENAIDMEKFNH